MNNTFRPNFVGLEDRSLMSASILTLGTAGDSQAAATWDLGTWSKKLHIASETNESSTSSSGLSSGKVSMSDLSAVPLNTSNTYRGQTQVNQGALTVSVDNSSNTTGLFRLFGDLNGDGATSKSGHDSKQIQIESWSLGATNSTGYAIELEDILISSATDETAQTREHILLARQVGLPATEEAAGITKTGAGTIVFNSVNIDATAGYYQALLGRSVSN